MEAAVSATERGLALVILLPLTYLAVRGIGRFRQLWAEPMDTREYRGWLNSPSLPEWESVGLTTRWRMRLVQERLGAAHHVRGSSSPRIEAVEKTKLPRAEDHRAPSRSTSSSSRP